MFSKKKPLQFLVPAFGAHLPGVKAAQTTKMILYPPPNLTERGFDLEYTPLLLTESIIIDRTAFDFVRNSDLPYLAEMSHTLKVLDDAGKLQIEDYALKANEFAPAIQGWLEQQLRYPERWLDALRAEYALFKPFIGSQVSRMGKHANIDHELISYGVHCHMAASSDKFDLREARRLQAYVETPPRNYSSAELDEIREIVRPMLTQVILDRMLAEAFEAPCLDWDDLEPFHAEISAPSGASAKAVLSSAHLQACKQMFSVALNTLKPNSVEQVLKFIRKSSAVRSLRSQIQLALSTDTEINMVWANKVQAEAADALLTFEERAKVFRYISYALSCLGPVSAVAHVVGYIPDALELIKEPALDGAEALSEHGSRSQFAWYYTLLSTSRSSRKKPAANAKGSEAKA